MNRRLRVLGIIAIAFIVLLALWMANLRPHSRPAPSSLQDSVHSAVNGTVEFVKSRVTGGVGAMLTVDNATGLPKINSVLPGSPAEMAGLRRGDIIIKVGDRTTAGQSLAQVVDAIRGFTGGTAAVTVQRPGLATNITFAIQRSSWNTLRVTNSFLAPKGGVATNSLP